MSAKVSKHLESILLSNRFIKKGQAFFRIHGDGVIQVVKNEYERNGDVPYILSIGLMSMYGELEPGWFTSFGCIPRYDVASLTGLESITPTTDQEEIMLQEGIPFLNEIVTQKLLLDGICRLDMAEYGKIYWLDELKIAPFLACGNRASAERVVTSFLQQHQSARESWRGHWPEAQYALRCQRSIEEDKPLLQLLSLIQNGSTPEIQAYLDQNYNNNCALAFKNLKRNPGGHHRQ